MHTLYMAIIVFLSCLVSLRYLHPFAVRFNLVDSPNERKPHNGHVPLVGGLSTLLGIWLIQLLMPNLIPSQESYTLLVSFLVLIGLIDDKFDISAISRLVILSLVALWLVKKQDISLSYLGDFTGDGDIILGEWTTLFTVCAVIGCITAFNMVDGIDGLLGALASVSIGSLGVMFWNAGQHSIAQFCFMLIVSMLAYICFNLSIKVKSKHRVFMGDSGSFLVGFSILWLLVFSTQKMNSVENLNSVMRPVTALWIISIPLMDMVLVIIRRILNKKSPLKADKTHIHHIILSLGYTPKQALLRISLLSCLLASFGIFLEIEGVHDVHSFSLFIVAFLLYSTASLLLQAKQKAIAL
ncbi:Undecaprenyl-phosphate N-acetylglucosaminyl 1-phosphate transferase [Vibrio coralliirubri]|uniref:UDP-N-acetylglucosamine--undecaprenyl-phosphate N-acetylglucosaminephosphotransferase n=1 Tax=Vibrio coralliirubri TaxID=1516159 RepID=UPI000630CC44|nr:UDP-N-acetylglucosamine--undecaprenyl-phosphate N-acetylglucosaminephosphotransferase [Vibrio coralliirubri]CDT39070.1 Undecaprenyl-phosphate N-acetylglucosaminyl 1-phosphate transferase [Vibrio coralliirubri]